MFLICVRAGVQELCGQTQEEGAADQGEKAPDDAGGESTPEE